MFFEYFSSFIIDDLGSHYNRIERNYHPTNEIGFETDFAILDNEKLPIYIMGIKSDLQASRATSFCFRMANEAGNHISIAVHEDPYALSKRDRDALTNAVYKQYTSLNDFKTSGNMFITKSIAS